MAPVSPETGSFISRDHIERVTLWIIILLVVSLYRVGNVQVS